jgi:hypothetical protein
MELSYSYADKKNYNLLYRLVSWRKSNLLIEEIKSELTKRRVDFHPKALKPKVAELLRQTLERHLQHCPLPLSKIRTIQIEALEYGRNKDGYNKKGLIGKLQSRGLSTKGTKEQLRARLTQVMQQEKRGFEAKWAEIKAKKAAASSFQGPATRETGTLQGFTSNAEPPAVAAAATASKENWKISNVYGKTNLTLTAFMKLHPSHSTAFPPSNSTLTVEQEKQQIEANRLKSMPYPAVSASSSKQHIAACSFSQSSALTAEQSKESKPIANELCNVKQIL